MGEGDRFKPEARRGRWNTSSKEDKSHDLQGIVQRQQSARGRSLTRSKYSSKESLVKVALSTLLVCFTFPEDW